jgi:sugar phosphate isomerase/epimerase
LELAFWVLDFGLAEAKMPQTKRREFLKSGIFSAAGITGFAGSAEALSSRSAPFAAEVAGTPPAFRLGLVTYNLAADWNIETIINNCEKTGFVGAELRTTHKHGVEPSLSKQRREEVKKRFADSKVRLVSLGTTCEYESPEAGTVEKNIEETRRWCELAQDLGCLGVKVRPNGFPRDVPHEQTLEQIGHALAKCGDIARDHGVEIWMEVHGEGTQIPANAHQILSVANHPLVGACWNSNPTDVENGSVRKTFELLKPWIRSCHINNLDNAAYPWHELFTLFRSINFDRYTFAEVGEPTCEPLRFMSYYHAVWDYHAGLGRP